MAETVELNVRSQLAKIADDLMQISRTGKMVEEEMSNFGKNVGQTHVSAVKQSETYLSKLRGMGARVFKTMKDDFRAMMSTVGISEGLKLGNTFRTNIKESFELSDTIRKLGAVFKIAEGDFASFQTRITRGMGEIGLGADAAISALKGLQETQVRGEEELTAYSTTAGQLAAISGTQGQEGAIAKGIAGVITAQGEDPNDIARMEEVSRALQKAYNATGKIPSAILQALETVIASMPSDMRKSIATEGLVQLGTAAAVGGPGATKFLEEMLGKSPVARKALEARGFGGVFGPKGLDIEKFRKAAKGIMDAFPDDPRLMAQTLGLSEDAAEGFVRLYESLDRMTEAQRLMMSDNKKLTDQYHEAMGAAEAFRASLNRVKSSFASQMSGITDFVTSGLKEAYQFSLSDLMQYAPDWMQAAVAENKDAIPEALNEGLGATATVAGAGLLATMMTGGGIRGLVGMGKGKATGVGERIAYEQATGRRVQDVYVVNATEIGMASGTGGADLATGGSFMALMKKAGLVAAAAAAGYMVGDFIGDQLEGTELEKKVQGTVDRVFGSKPEDFTVPPVIQREGAPQRDVLGRTPQIITPEGQKISIQDRNKPQKVDVRVDVNVKTTGKDLKATARPSRGGAQ